MGRMTKDHQLPMLVVETGPFSEQKNREQVKVGGGGLHFRVRDFSERGAEKNLKLNEGGVVYW